MLEGRKIVVVLPAYRAAATLERTYDALPRDLIDEVLLVDDASDDETVAIARRLGIRTFVHRTNRGYGANQKTCYREALALGADIVVMLHPDYQYDPRLVPAMASMIATGVYDVALGSRILGGRAREGGMPLYKYAANRALTLIQNLALGAKLSEFHTGYRAYSRQVLEQLPLSTFSEDFVFDNQILLAALRRGYRIGEISCPARYDERSSSIGLSASVRYGLGVLATTLPLRRRIRRGR
ncbi:MAG: glycosyltransferase family 2 protein [Acidobacteria bacterium]|nr:MAG: glycosyltransferase family 2 protein [Acidobacteriota bacterium]REK08917.1 MAG: glycosyltransferase family 2 protein [Acidobacteriota bacterium]